MKSDHSRAPRIVIYGTGQYGCFITRLVLDKGWSVVAAYNRAGDKVGKDLGRLAGLDRNLGVIVEDCDLADYSQLEADLAVVCVSNSLKVNFTAHQRLMGAGLNVLCQGSESCYPYGCEPDIASQIDELAKSKGVTFSGGGIWDMSRIWSGILLVGPCTSIESIFHSSITDVHAQAATMERAREVGIGLSVDEFNQLGLDKTPLANSYITIPEHVLTAVGYTIKSKAVRIEPVLYDHQVKNPWTNEMLQPGTCLGTRIAGTVETHQGVKGEINIELRIFLDDEIEHVYWSVEGSPRNELRNNRKDSAHTTAASLFNRIPDVIAAEPGIVLISQMGPLSHTALI